MKKIIAANASPRNEWNTGNAPEEYYTPDGYGRMVENYRNTLQVSDYERYNRTMFVAMLSQKALSCSTKRMVG